MMHVVLGLTVNLTRIRSYVAASVFGSISRIDPRLDVVEEILRGVRILAGRTFARHTRELGMSSAFNDDKVLILALRKVIVNFIETQVSVRAHGSNQ
jgi:hypothetical protein